MHRRPIPAVLVLASFAAPVLAPFANRAAAQAPAPVVAKIVEAGSEANSQVTALLDHLTNQIGPRLTGSERLTQACEWARSKFVSFGLANARLVEWGEVEVGFDRGTHTGWLQAGGGERRPLVFGTNAWTPGTDGLKQGRALLAPEEQDGLDAFANKVKGCWVVRDPKASPDANAALDRLCVQHGAHGVIGNGTELILTAGDIATRWESLPKLVRIRLLGEQYQDLVERLRQGEAPTLGFDVQNHFKKGPVKVFNVLAEIKGTEKPGELVIVGGHIDSWDGATGTTDNGTGVATTLEAARLLMQAGAKPKRTIRFMLWSGEEQGLLGSQEYIKQHPGETDRISAVLVHDGGTNYVSGIATPPPLKPIFAKVFAPVFRIDQETMPFTLTEVAALPYPIGSDHDSYIARGVPGFFWNQSGKAVYQRTHHTQHDTFDAAVPEYQRHSAIVIAIGALGIANLPALLPRDESMFKGPNAAVSTRRLGVELAPGSMQVESVMAGRPGARAGIKTKDVLVAVDGQSVKNETELSAALNAGGVRKKVRLKRGEQELDVTVEFRR